MQKSGHRTKAAVIERLPLRFLGKQPDLLSPLRYPGSKRQLIPFFCDLFEENDTNPELFVEPFAGGAAVGLHLVASGLIDRLLLADVDPLIASFWETACFDTHWLMDAMWETQVTVDNWRRFHDAPGRSKKDKALACLFLNRTSFSGILHRGAGPLGGWSQESEYKIDCRFPKATLEQRLQEVGKLADNGLIEDVWNLDYKTTVARLRRRAAAKRGELVIYFDPPFYAKSQDLYRHSFDKDDHERLAGLVSRLNTPWVLSYDFHPEVEQLYVQKSSATHQLHIAECSYRASAPSRKADELIITNFPKVPRR